MQIVVISMPQNRDRDKNGANIICVMMIRVFYKSKSWISHLIKILTFGSDVYKNLASPFVKHKVICSKKGLTN